MKPLAFVDVDGVLNRFVSNSQARRRGLLRRHAWCHSERVKLLLDPADKDRLLRLTPVFDLAWGTAWESSANAGPGALLGLPELDVVARTYQNEGYDKAPGVVRAAKGRPFVWFDDDVKDGQVRADQPHRVIRVDPYVGLTDEDVDTALTWWSRVDGT